MYSGTFSDDKSGSSPENSEAKMSLKPDLKKTLAEVLSKNGMPPVIDKTFNSIWDTFAKTQPSKLNTTLTGDTDVYGNLQRSLEKYGVDPKYAKQVVARVQKKYGDKPTNTDIKNLREEYTHYVRRPQEESSIEYSSWISLRIWCVSTQ
ncbi:unnamed protein product [Allacma fusca]|uniref:Uncharacterized protein n=1 Tax=Allacma fusca TaxID=39272 RepID=A0A8J2P0B0_9HEXA|nr:unnamed protein product [Allacma fusca]